MSEECLPVGELVGTHGLAGWLKLKSFDPDSESLSSARELAVVEGSKAAWYTLAEAKRHKRIFLIKLEGVDQITVAEQLVGREVWVHEDNLEPLREGQYFYRDVLGFDVFDAQSHFLGRITRIWFKAGGNLYVVSGAGKEHLLPANKEMIAWVDIPGRRMIVDLPEGLLDL